MKIQIKKKKNPADTVVTEHLFRLHISSLNSFPTDQLI